MVWMNLTSDETMMIGIGVNWAIILIGWNIPLDISVLEVVQAIRSNEMA